jgi:hypothetical protein
MSVTANKSVNTTQPPVVREYDIGDTKYIVSATVKAGANETATAIIRRLIKNDVGKKNVK